MLSNKPAIGWIINMLRMHPDVLKGAEFQMYLALSDSSWLSSQVSGITGRVAINKPKHPADNISFSSSLPCFPVALACLGERPTGSAPQASTQSIPCTQPCHFLPQTSLIPISATHNKYLPLAARPPQIGRAHV